MREAGLKTRGGSEVVEGGDAVFGGFAGLIARGGLAGGRCFERNSSALKMSRSRRDNVLMDTGDWGLVSELFSIVLGKGCGF